jgi:sulfur-oxidizing protein SoxY
MITRRQTIKQTSIVAGLLATQGLLAGQANAAYNRPAFEAKTWSEALKANGALTISESKEINLTAPDIAENGAVVPFAISTSLANIKQIVLLVEKNPTPLVAIFNLTDAIEPNFTTRSKMGETSEVYAVAITNDQKAYFAKKEVKVTLGGCGG